MTYGWDGEWFLRAYDFAGNKIGSSECDEGKIFIESPWPDYDPPPHRSHTRSTLASDGLIPPTAWG